MISFEEIPNELVTNWKKLAEYTAKYEFLDEMKKVILANESPIDWTEGFKDRTARMSDNFKEHLEWLKEARQLMLEAKTYQEALNARFEYYRTENANRRSEMNLR